MFCWPVHPTRPSTYTDNKIGLFLHCSFNNYYSITGALLLSPVLNFSWVFWQQKKKKKACNEFVSLNYFRWKQANISPHILSWGANFIQLMDWGNCSSAHVVWQQWADFLETLCNQQENDCTCRSISKTRKKQANKWLIKYLRVVYIQLCLLEITFIYTTNLQKHTE